MLMCEGRVKVQSKKNLYKLLYCLLISMYIPRS